jgi:predicted glycosyltransferase/predicted transcriptional regulator
MPIEMTTQSESKKLSKQESIHPIRKIWIAISTPFQVNFFYPLIERLKKNFDFILTARNHDRIFSMLDARGLDYFPVGLHGGSTLHGKLQAYARTVQELAPIIEREKPDLLLTERWPEAVRVAFGLNIPAWTIYYDERERHVNRMVFPLSAKVFAPSFYTRTELQESGVNPENVVWFNGFHTCYLKGQTCAPASKNPFEKFGINSPIVLIRPEPEFATFFHQKQNVLERTVSFLANNGGLENDFNVVVVPRTKEQAVRYAKYPVTVMVDAIPDNPVAYADVTVGAAETMLMEAFVLGKPAVSTVYWEESKPVIELHRYIPHITEPKEAAAKVINFLNPEEQHKFREKAKLVTNLMENPIQKIEEEINNLCGEAEPALKSSSMRRGRLEIYMEILGLIAFRPLKVTHIMQAANLSYSKVRQSLAWLTNKNLVQKRRDPSGGLYFKTTPDGMVVLAEYKKIAEKLF